MNIELLLVRLLNDALDIPVSTDIPANRPDNFVVLERTGGRRRHGYDTPTVAIQVYGKDRVNASKSADTVARALESLVSHPTIGSVSITGPYNYPDLDAKHSRYQLTVNLVTV